MSVLSLSPDAFVQVLEWKTDILKARNGSEQRIANRLIPRQTYKVKYLADSHNEIQYWKYNLGRNLNAIWNVPIWSEAEKTTSAVTGGVSSTVDADFTMMDDTFGLDFLIISPDELQAELFTISGRTATTATRDAGTFTDDYPIGSLIVPVEDCYLENNSTYNPHQVNAATIDLTFRPIAHRALEGKGATALTLLDTTVVLEERPLQDGARETFGSRRDLVDFGGVFELFTEQSTSDIVSSRLHRTMSKAEFQRWKLYFNAFRGQQKVFMASTWRHDMTVTTQPTLGGGTFQVDENAFAAGWDNVPSRRYLAIETADGATQYKKVDATGTIDNGDGTHTVSVTPSFTSTADGSTIVKVSFLEPVRLAADSIDIDHRTAAKDIGLAFRTVPEDPDIELGPALLADFLFAEPVTSWTVGRDNFTSEFATDEWTFQSHTAGSYPNNVATATMDNSNGLTDRTAVGLYDGTSLTGLECWEGVNNVANISCSSTTVGDPGTGDICVRVVFRVHAETWAVSDGIVSKRDNSGTFDGWSIQMNSAGIIYMTLDDGATTDQSNAVGGIDTRDGAWHAATWFWDASTDTSYLTVDGVEDVHVTAGLGTITSTNNLCLNHGRWGHNSSSGKISVAYLGVCEGINAQSMYDEEYWQHATDPTGLLTTVSRDSAISVPVSATQVAPFAAGTGTAAQMPIGYNANFTDAGQLGLYCNSGVTNLSTYSEELSNWTQVNASTLDKQADGPDGFRGMSEITASANNGYIAETFTTVASTEYTVSVYVEESTAGVTGRVIFYDETGAAELASDTFTATGSPQLVTVTATTNVGQVSSSCRIEIDTNTEAVYAWGAQYNLGDGRGAYIHTNGAPAVLVNNTYTAQGVAGWIDSSRGESESIWVSGFATTPGANAYLYNLQGTGSNDRHLMRNRSNGRRVQFYLFDSTGTYHDDLGPAGQTDMSAQENTLIAQWHDDAGLAAAANCSMAIDFNAGTYTEAPSFGSYAGGSTATDVDIGCNATSDGADGFIQRIRFWESER